MWSAQDAADEPFAAPEGTPVGPAPEEKLLGNGTVWLPERGLGLVLWEGAVMDVVWRDARDLPARYVGPVTEAQRQLSKRPDLDEYLREGQAAAEAAATPKDPLAPLHILLVLL